jgi:acetyltransferase-like isoleucine patch superfamily enzyme
MRIIFKLASIITKLELFLIKNKFKFFGKNVSIGIFSTIENPQYIQLFNNITIGKNVNLYAIDNDLISKRLPNLTIGNNIYIGHYVSIHCMNNVTLEDNVVLSDYIYISDVAHGLELDLEESIMKQPWVSPGPVIIGKGTFLGHGVKVLPNVRIGNNCIVASGSIVTKNFDPYCILAGSPAEVIKRYCFETKTWKRVNN